jgi:gliding motility-associated lipoprotein GldH
MKQNRNSILLLVGLLFLIVSCRPSAIYEKYYEVKGSCWNKDSIAHFSFPISDTVSRYNFLIDVRNQGNYPFSNLWLFVNITAPDSTILRDTFELQLARPDGKWLGHGTAGLYDMKSDYRKNIYFPLQGNYSITLQQGMYSENNCLKGIRDIGVRIEKSH